MNFFTVVKRKILPKHYAKLDAIESVLEIFPGLYPDEVINTSSVIADEENYFVVRVLCRMTKDNSEILVRPPRVKWFIFSVDKINADVVEIHDDKYRPRFR